KNVLWLCGPVGSGKSGVAATLFDEFTAKDQLGGHFFGKSLERHPSLMIQTLAALLDNAPLAREIAARIANDPTALHSSLKGQFMQLLLKPLQA
ncbi:hypothetical protein FB451DRAFT_941595, partial [Mycena latifolia]